jgi:signal transduction histidine kinase
MEQVQKLEAVATLSGGLAHNFNNLLSVIMGLTDLMLSNTGPGHDFFEDLKEIELQVRAGRELTQNLLAFARGTRFEMQPLSLNELVRSTADMFARTRRDIQIVQGLAADLPLVEVDSSQIQQVLMNFLINAWQAMPGGGEIRLQTRTVKVTEWHDPAWELQAPGVYVVLSVSDRGVGMDEETLSHIFEPFFTTKPPDQGTGLGLSSAYRIIKSHRGAIQVKSRKGRGTTFSILLPISRSQPRPLSGEESRIVHGQGTILVVDDEPVLRRVAGRLLEKLGYRVIPADSGDGDLSGETCGDQSGVTGCDHARSERLPDPGKLACAPARGAGAPLQRLRGR